MRKKRIILIEPQSREDHVYKYVPMPRLGLPLLGARLKAAGFSVGLYKGTGASLPWPRLLEADLVGVSTTTSTSREAYRIAGYLRSHNIPVVIGGIHATFMPDEALQFADYVLRGEADLTFLPLVRALEQDDSLLRHIPGLSYRRGGAVVHNPPCPRPVEMDDLPMPDFSLFENRKRPRTLPVMTSRGCPFNCVFCCVHKMFGRRYRFRSTEKVLQELAGCRGRFVFFCDDNFTADVKRSKELLRAMLESNLGLTGWGAQVRTDAAKDDELMELMRRAGAKIVYIGLESINPETLQAYHKQQSVADIKASIRKFHRYGIRVHGMFVFGSDSDTVQTLRETVDFALEARIDSVQFLILTPLPGTPLFERLEAEGRILTRNWELYDGHHVVFQPAQMSPEELQRETVAATKRFYAPRHVFRNVFLTGWSSSLYRAMGWWLVHRFERHNRWYNRILRRKKRVKPEPVALLYRLLKGRAGRSARETAVPELKISFTESAGVLYLKLQGIVNRFTLKELNRSVRKLLPPLCLHLVIQAEELRFSSDWAARGFSLFLERSAERARRLQVVISRESARRHLLKLGAGRRLRLPRFEILLD